ncbi:MAG: hypothetical protein ABSF80_03650 [Chitinispirillaceae bacterium]
MTRNRAGESDSNDNETEYYCDIRRLALYSAHHALFVLCAVRMMVQR